MAVVRATWLLCDEPSYGTWQQEVEALPLRLRKRKNWSRNVREITGVLYNVFYAPTTLPSGAVCLFATKVNQRQAAAFGMEAGATMPFITGAMEMREAEAAQERGERLVDLKGNEITPYDMEALLAEHAEHVRQRDEQGAPQHKPRVHRMNPPQPPQTFRVRR
jgi:hypothetical protein